MLAVDKEHRDFFSVAGAQFIVLKNIELFEVNALMQTNDLGRAENASNNVASVVTEVASRLDQECELKSCHSNSVGDCAMRARDLLLVAALMTSLTKQLAVLLLRHTLATLLND